MNPRNNLALVVMTITALTLAGCTSIKRYSTSLQVDDTLCVNGEMISIVGFRQYAEPMLHFHPDGPMTKQTWTLVKCPFPSSVKGTTTKREFLRMDGSNYHEFLLINGSDFMVHQLHGAYGRQFTIFDSTTKKDLSPPFPSQPGRLIFNRSRTACLTMEAKQAVIVDTLSLKNGAAKSLTHLPHWTPAFERLKSGMYHAVLTDDNQHLVLFPDSDRHSRFNTNSLNDFVCEVWATDGRVEKWKLPIERMQGKFLDAEAIDGKILLLWETRLPNGYQDSAQLLNTKGETIHSGTVSAFNHPGPMWNPKRHEILYPHSESEHTDRRIPRVFDVWNYSSNVIKRIRVMR